MSPAVFTRAAAHQPGCSPGCSPTPWVLNSKVMVPTAPRKTHSHVPKHLLDTSAASWSTRQGCDPSYRGWRCGNGPGAAGGHPPSPLATGARGSQDWGHRGERGSPAGGSRLGLSLHLVGTWRDVAAAPDRGPGRAAPSSPGTVIPRALRPRRVPGAAPCAPIPSQSPVGSYTPSHMAVPEGSRDTGTEVDGAFGADAVFSWAEVVSTH